MTEPLRIGVLGAARITELALITPAGITGDRVVAVAARDPERAAAFAKEHGVERVLPDYAALVADPEVEVIYNPLANALHGPWNRAAIDAGKHVLSEKPFASNAEEARRVEPRRSPPGWRSWRASTTCTTPSCAGCTPCSTPGSWARCAGWRRTSPCPPRRTATRAGRSRWPAAR